MADTLPDEKIPNDEFIDVYAVTGIAVGTSIIIQNKGNFPILVREVALEPTATSTDGFTVHPYDANSNPVVVVGSPSGVWVRTISSKLSCKINVQEFVT